ncbi:RING finger protein 37 [Latimeria chalumnae]|nr:PREDICTED: RING finger protein 37 [Latimeria chalumnae]|eukprot:XP_006006076.1 PREDICTED: RING finger protein 37 [Latimeria chalumnae]
MVINLCLPQYRPRIHCNKVCADGYEVQNLISADPMRKSLGFRAEYFIKPPVHITITFPFNVELYRIDIVAMTGQHHVSTKLEIYTSTSSNKTTWEEMLTHGPDSVSQGFSDGDIFTLVGRAVLKKENKVSLVNRSFRLRPPFDKIVPESLGDESLSQDLWRKGPSSLVNVTHLKMCISHVAGGIPTGFKRFEVWGQPARSCPPQVLNSILKLYCESLPQDFKKSTTHLAEFEDASRSNSEPMELVETLENIPSDFLDPITLELMPFPILLPSGKVIDQSTLEKYNKSEATWGRLPNDPFTGVPYSQNSKPLPQASLKARIDRFLLHNSVLDTGMLGRIQASGPLVPSCVATCSFKRKAGCVEKNSEAQGFKLSAVSAYNSVDQTSSHHAVKKIKIETIVNVPQNDYPDSMSHEQRLSQSLDSALASALSSLPSFTTKLREKLQHPSNLDGNSTCDNITTAEHNRSNPVQGCAVCSKAFSPYFKAEAVYRFPCGHLMCRPCLTQRQQSSLIMCVGCEKLFATSDVLRVHF